MKKFLVLLLLLAVAALPVRASHLYGADFYYTHLAGNTYEVTLEVYGDCAGAQFQAFPLSTPVVRLLNGGAIVQTFTLSLQQPLQGVEVTPVCPAQQNNTACKNGTIPGVTRFTYKAICTVPSASPSWKFRYTGVMSSGGTVANAGRSNAITNLLTSNNTTSLLVLEAELNNSTSAVNSSPRFTTIPTPFYCVNTAQQYNQGAVDADNDQLTYALVGALGLDGAPVAYVNGYSGASPLAAAPGSFSFSATTGQLSFTPNMLQQSTVVNKVTEYRNGVKVGSAMREMTFVVLPCNNNPPSGVLNAQSPVAGGQFNPASGFVEVCEGSSPVSFHIYPTDPEGTAITVTASGAANLPGAAAVTIAGNGTPNPDVTFSWNTAGVAPGLYTIFITYKDAGCPLASLQTQAYVIRVVRRPVVSHAVVSATGCVGKAAVNYLIEHGLTPRTITVSQGSNTIRTITGNSADVVPDSLGPGTYTITVTSAGLPCATSYQLTVVDSGRYPYRPVSDSAFFCVGETGRQMTASAQPGAALAWHTLAGTALQTAPFVNTAVAGAYRWLVYQSFLNCRSLPDTAVAYVTERPVAAFSLPPQSCAREAVEVRFTGQVGQGPILQYAWDWQGASQVSGADGGPYQVRWDSPGTKFVQLQVFENKCASAPVSGQITVRPTPLPLFSAGNTCATDTLRVRYEAVPLHGQQYAWTFPEANIPQAQGMGPFDLVWEKPGRRSLQLAVDLNGCRDTARQDIEVHPKPVAMVEALPGDPCLGDQIYLRTDGRSTYSWSPAERIFTQPDGRLYTYAMVPTTYTVTASNQYGCSDSASWAIRSIQPCCNFTYPNAFSPNGDGHNDRFRVVMWGNPDRYDFSIYNRWGQRMFHSFDPKESWDGTFKGEPCDIGTYMYYLKARCMTGREETQSGDVMLIR